MALEMSGVMVDWLTVETPDPVGIPINGGQVVKISADNSVEWSTFCRKSVEGSWSSSMTFRAIGAEYVEEMEAARRELGHGRRRSGLEISGNVTKFLQGHNLFGSDDPAALLGEVIAKAKGAIWPDLFEDPEIDFSSASISRIDLTGSWLLEREADVDLFLRAMEERVWCPFRGRGKMDDVGTLYYGRSERGKRAKDWQLKLYNKGREIGVHKLPQPAYSVPGLLDEVNRTVRVELTLRTAELKRLGMAKVSDWNPEKVGQIWRSYVDRLDFGESALMRCDTSELAGILKPRELDAVAAWRAGNDLRHGRSTATVYRLRKRIMELTGIDIFTSVPKSNVVPLRRVVTAQPALRPQWADHLTAALEKAA